MCDAGVLRGGCGCCWAVLCVVGAFWLQMSFLEFSPAFLEVARARVGRRAIQMREEESSSRATGMYSYSTGIFS